MSMIKQLLIVAFLSAILFNNALASRFDWWMREGKGYDLCETLYKQLIKYKPDDLGACVASIALALPGMQETEDWQELDPHEYKKLLKELFQYEQMGVRAYFGQWSEYAQQKRFDDNALEKLVQGFVAGGGRMRVKTFQLIRHPLGSASVEYAKPQILVELRNKNNLQMCLKAPRLVDKIKTYYVTHDLMGPDPEIPQYEAVTLAHAQIVMYRGVVHLMSTDGGVSLYRDFGTGQLKRFCEIQRGRR